ncbi:MAG: SUMF1/EgtB/PvdO family nonheme iron enzyme, partial [Bacteroidales bacterium]|nr:SUMF1/EgtB/PvdO family nonheme iron enzyme [Bacteroidales bacterium]
MKISKKNVLSILFILIANSLLANNLIIKNSVILEKNLTSGYMQISFDLTWENSWRLSTMPNNYDAVWIFAKYRIAKGEWKHCNISTLDGTHIAASGSTIETTSDGKGIFVYRSDIGTGNVDFTGMQIRWDYELDAVNDTDVVKVQLFGIEMVRINDGSFYIGDFDGVNESINAFHGGDNNPVFIWENIVQNINVDVNNYDDDTIESGIGINGIAGIDTNNDGIIDNENYPTGYFGFYAMKYEISQKQYIDFLNSLNRTQQNERTQSDINQLSILNRFVLNNSTSPTGRNAIACAKEQNNLDEPIDFFSDLDDDGIANENYDGANIACNYLSWADGAAYADWAGLRPMTELEFEKASRGPISAIYGEYVWGTTDICTQVYGLSEGGSSLETIFLDADNGNALY